MTLQQLAQEVRDLSKETLKVDPSQPQVTVKGEPIRSYLSHLADRIDELASKAYNEIDGAVCATDDISSVDIDYSRNHLEETLGDYYD